MISRIEQQLGRTLDYSRRNSVVTLNDIPPDMLDDLRRLGPECLNWYLGYHLKRGNETAFEDFIRDVVIGGMDPKNWGYHDRLALVDDRSGEPLTMSVENTKELLSEVEGERWVCYSVDNAVEANRRAVTGALGAPGVLVRHAPYWWAPRREVSTHFLSPRLLTKTISDRDFDVAFRRWIARRVTWWAKPPRVDLTTASADQVVAALGIDASRVTADGAIALAALLREARLPFDPNTQVRGYIGPDAWYLA